MTTASSALASPARPRAARPRWPLLALVAAILALIGGVAVDRWRGPAGPEPLDPASVHAGYGPVSYAEALAAAGGDVAAARESLALGRGEWLREEILARALMGRFRLAGDYADLVEADRLLDAGMARAPDPAGPVLSRARFSGLVHRLDQADAALARFARWSVPFADERSVAESLGGDIALQRGQLEVAARHFRRADALAGEPGTDLRSALLEAHRGDREAGKRALEALLAQPRQAPGALAELALQRANLAYAEGDWDKAGRWVAQAERVFPGYWLTQAYAAQQEALAGRPEAAIRSYHAIAERTARPEVMDALAHLLRLEGRAVASRAWAARAEQAWQTRYALFPEAAGPHLAEHELAVGSVRRALALAQDDATRRPYGPSIALLARALILEGQPGEALAWLDRAERQGWVSAGMLMLRADAEAARGNAAASTAARERAEAINPRAADPRSRMIWFGHD